MSHRITAVYQNKSNAIKAIHSLESAGFCEEKDISLIASADSWSGDEIEITEHSKAPKGASVGATLGGVTGAIVGGLSAIGTITLTGGAGLLAAGPIVGALAGAGAGGATGGIVGGLIGMGVPETDAKLFDERINKGNIILAVEASNEHAQEIESLLKNTDAQSVMTQ